MIYVDYAAIGVLAAIVIVVACMAAWLCYKIAEDLFKERPYFMTGIISATLAAASWFWLVFRGYTR